MNKKKQIFNYPLTLISKIKKNTNKSGNFIFGLIFSIKTGNKFSLKFIKNEKFNKKFFEDLYHTLLNYFKPSEIENYFAFSYYKQAYNFEDKYKGHLKLFIY